MQHHTHTIDMDKDKGGAGDDWERKYTPNVVSNGPNGA